MIISAITSPAPDQNPLTSILVRNNLGLVVHQVGDGAVGVAEGDADDGALAWLRASLSPSVTHYC